jgi:SAM-dependent methyltransferase
VEPAGRDLWLERWLPLMSPSRQAPGVLELGCDDGRDTAYLLSKGFPVVATDVSAEALIDCGERLQARFVLHDLRTPLPFADGEFATVLASLCLHYFGWEQTKEMVKEIRRVLAKGGMLLCRLNSTQDLHFGAVGHEQVEPDFYAVQQRFGDRKRFFDRKSVDALFDKGWKRVALAQTTIDRYQMPKTVWEIVLRKSAG